MCGAGSHKVARHRADVFLRRYGQPSRQPDDSSAAPCGASVILRAMSGPRGARGRRFEGVLDPVAAALNASVGFDRRLLHHDVAGSIAHAEMLAAQGLIAAGDATAIVAGLRRVEAALAAGELAW